MEDFLEVLLVGFTCNLVVGIHDVKWVHQEVTISRREYQPPNYT